MTGPGALDLVQRLAMRQMDVPIGRNVYTPILTESGGFKQDLTIMRLADDVFRVVTGGAYGMSDLKWFRDHRPRRRLGSGPRADERLVHARALGLARAGHSRVGHGRRRQPRGLSVRCCRTREIGAQRVMASRISDYVGDLGWELYAPMEQGVCLWDVIAEADRRTA